MNRAAGLPRLPLGLCGMLVIAAAGVLFPRWGDSVARPARWLMCLPLRALPVRHVDAAGNVPLLRAAASSAVLDRLAGAAIRAAAPVSQDVEPVLCRVLERRVPGAAHLPTLLVLDRSWSEVESCTGLVTRAGCLVGFLGQPGDASDLVARGHAVVRCVHAAPQNAPVARLIGRAWIDDAPVRFVLEPGSRIDPWPLRVGLIEDPYRAARVGSVGHSVRTCGGSVGSVSVPPGLELGTLRVWGYVERGTTTLPVGFFVEPAFDARAIATVVLWRPPTTASPAASAPLVAATADIRACRGVLLPSGRRLYLVTGTLDVPPGAAVVGRDGQLFGTVDEAGPGDAVASAFAASGRNWSLLLVPDDVELAPIECSATIRTAGADTVELQLGSPVPPFTGDVLTGGQGLHCPPGLWIGSIDSWADDGRRLTMRCPAPDLSSIGVCVLAESAP